MGNISIILYGFFVRREMAFELQYCASSDRQAFLQAILFFAQIKTGAQNPPALRPTHYLRAISR